MLHMSSKRSSFQVNRDKKNCERERASATVSHWKFEPICQTSVHISTKVQLILSRTPLNPYLSVDGSGYGLLEVMGYEGV